MVNFSRNMQSHIDLINVIAVKIRFLFIEVYRLECIKTMWRQISELIQIQKKTDRYVVWRITVFKKVRVKSQKKNLSGECSRDLANNIKYNLVQSIVLHAVTSQKYLEHSKQQINSLTQLTTSIHC